ALAVPEQYGGAGFTSFETHLVLEQLGASLSPSPLLGSAVLATRALLASGDESACRRILPGLAQGSTIGALAWADARGRWRTNGSDVRASHGEGSAQLDGVATLVLDGARADILLVVAETEQG